MSKAINKNTPFSARVAMTKTFALLLLLLVVASGSALRAEEQAPFTIIKTDESGHGMLLKTKNIGKRVLIVSGTPEQMGAAHGKLMAKDVQEISQMRINIVATGYSLGKGDWFFNRIEEVNKRSLPHTPERFMRECDAMAEAAGIPARDCRNANYFPEMFHCSGTALRGKATVGGKVLHARVLDYMKDIGLQTLASVQVFIPEKHNTWMSLGYSGFIGTVTAMNEHGLAVGEMGGRGEGNWDGCPMNMLLRDIMERAKTVKEALKILQETPRTCEYYYVFSDRTGDIVGTYCTPEKVEILLPGKQHELLPKVPEDTVLLSGPGRAEALSKRIQEKYGKIDAKALIEIIKRPVCMKSNLHNAVFAPEDLDMWFADAGKKEIAANMPYEKVNLKEIVEFYKKNLVKLSAK